MTTDEIKALACRALARNRTDPGWLEPHEEHAIARAALDGLRYREVLAPALEAWANEERPDDEGLSDGDAALLVAMSEFKIWSPALQEKLDSIRARLAAGDAAPTCAACNGTTRVWAGKVGNLHLQRCMDCDRLAAGDGESGVERG